MNRKDYIAWCITYCKEYAWLHQLYSQVSNGEVIEPKELDTTVKRLAYAQEKFMQAKADCHYDGGLSFLEDNAFKGFSIKDGKLSGDVTYAYEIASPWYYSFVNGSSDNSYTFEVGCLIGCIAEREKIMKRIK